MSPRAPKRPGRHTMRKRKRVFKDWEELMVSVSKEQDSRFKLFAVGTLVAFFVSVGLGGEAFAQTRKAEPFTLTINQSPWLGGFKKLVEAYTAETGNMVILDVNPLQGLHEKTRNSARAPEGTIDLFITNVIIMAEMWSSGLVHTMDELDPGFKLSDQISTFYDTTCWDKAKSAFDCKTGKLIGVPINPNVEVLYYRADLYKEKGLTVPRTMAELEANAIALHNPPKMFGIVQRGARSGIASNTRAYIYGFGGKMFADAKNGDYTVTLDQPESRRALQFYVDLSKKAGHPNAGGIAQGDMIQLAAAGRAAHFIGVIAAFAQLDDPDKSAVAGKFNIAVVPGSPPAPQLGHFISSIPRNVPRGRKLAAVEFLKWFQTKGAQEIYLRSGGVPVRKDVLSGELATKEAYRWMPALSKSFDVAGYDYNMPQANELIGIVELQFNKAMTGEQTVDQAIDRTAAEFRKVVKAAGLPGKN